MRTVLISDIAWGSTAIEEEVLAKVNARVIVAQRGEESELLALVPQADAILTCFRPITAAVVRAGKRLRVIGRYGVGTDNIAVDEATRLGIPVTNVPAYCVDEVVEHVLALLFCLARGVSRYDQAIRRGNWALSAGAPIHRIAGSTLGIVGLGQIGFALARRARSLGLTVVAHDHQRGNVAADAGIESVTLDQLAARSDFVSLHCPLNETTRGLIDGQFLASMKPTAYLLNAARGAIVDHDALAQALRERRIAGAGLDVFEPEPLASGHPLLSCDGLIATPHVAFYSEESLNALARRAAENVATILDNRRPSSIVNPQALQNGRRRPLRDRVEPDVTGPDGRLDASNIVDYLGRRGLIDPAAAKVEMLGGGVSNDVIAVDDGQRSLVVKQPLARLQVSEDWSAPRDRVLGEAAAIELCNRLTPHRAPRVLYRDDQSFVVVIDRAPKSWSDWKSRLLSGDVAPSVARWLGQVLATWHNGTKKRRLPVRLSGEEVFNVLRVDPYYQAVALRAPEHSGTIQALIAASARRRSCLVHGDFSPKNILVGPGEEGWVIDYEVAHRGDPAFDVAFLLSHLTLKAVHRRDAAEKFDACSLAFASAYAQCGGVVDWPHALAHVGALLLARVGGKSPVEYLSAADRGRIWRFGGDLLEAAPDSVDGLIARRKGLLS